MVKKLTPAEKAKATRDAKLSKAMEDLGFERKKVTRKRKPMSEEQKKAASERLAKAREARGMDGSKSVHPSLLEMPEDHFIHWKKVRQWVKKNEQDLKDLRGWKNSNISKQRMEYQDLQTYIHNMKKYLTHGVWLDFRYGEDRECKVTRVCIAMAYDKDGNPKRDYGTWYPDIATVWTRELEELWAEEEYED
ncbi:MAG: hypothetical protein CMO97_02665 [Woeseia sp.]|nr:hypothetical protein [Woeseia sp.]